MGVGMPEALKLEAFGRHVRAAFGHTPYHVGSSVTGKAGWRDVDVRVMLPDEVWAAFGLGDPQHTFSNARWVALTLAFSALGREMTGLPIDFQIQQLSHANANNAGPRSAIGVREQKRATRAGSKP